MIEQTDLAGTSMLQQTIFEFTLKSEDGADWCALRDSLGQLQSRYSPQWFRSNQLLIAIFRHTWRYYPIKSKAELAAFISGLDLGRDTWDRGRISEEDLNE